MIAVAEAEEEIEGIDIPDIIGAASPVEPVGHDRADEDSTAPERKRHASLMSLSEYLTAIAHGRAAEAHLERPEKLPELACLWVPPVFAWMDPSVSVGRKNKGKDGTELLMPHRMEWKSDIMVLEISMSEVHAKYWRPSWRTRTLGSQAKGSTKLIPTWEEHQVVHLNEDDSAPTSAVVPLLARIDLIARLQQIAEDGRVATWNLITQVIEPMLRDIVQRKHSSVSKEVAGHIGGEERPLLDPIDIEEVVAKMVLGDGESPGSKVHAIVDKLILPESLLKVEPMRRLVGDLNRDAKWAVLSKLEDPRVGSFVRRAWASYGRPGPEETWERIRDEHPGMSISVQMVVRSLTAPGTAMAGRFPLDS